MAATGLDAIKPQVPSLSLDSGHHLNRPDLIGSVRQLVGSVTASLKISPTSANGIEEALARLEATDDNFNRFVITC